MPFVRTLAIFAAALAGTHSALPAAEPSSEQEAAFEKHIRPLLAEKCFSCHGAKKQENGLRLDSRAAILLGGATGPAAVPGKPEESLLLSAVKHEGDFEMPPEERLPEEQVAALSEWIRAELPWPGSTAAPQPLTKAEQRVRDRAEHWAFQPVQLPPAAAPQDSGWVRKPVDTHIRANLEAAGIAPSPEANRRTLLRRLTFDLWGLPPTAEQLAAFEADERPDAYERLIEELLASPRYGERWARHWLDVARYADTKGYAFQKERKFPYAYTYRDYVIRSFNEDTPYDRFLIEQLAADKLELGDEERWKLSGLGLLTVGRRFNNHHEDIDDQIDVVTRGMLGLTVACARCHDHKYDAIPTEDYYSLYGVFASCSEPDELPLIDTPVRNEAYLAFEKELQSRQKKLEDYAAAKHNEIIADARGDATEYLAKALSDAEDSLLAKLPFLSLSPGDLKPQLVNRWRSYLRDRARPGHPVWGAWARLSGIPEDKFAEQAPAVLAELAALPEGMAEGSIQPRLKAILAEEPPAARVEIARVYGKLLAESLTAWKEAGESLDKLSAETRAPAEALVSGDSPTSIPRGELNTYLTRADRNKYRDLEKQVESHQANSPGAPPRAMVVRDKDRPFDPRVFLRGQPSRQGDHVPRRFVAVLSEEKREPFREGSGRMELARAIARRENPLTARVMVNRVWMHHFGLPLVDSPSDFGIRCEQPVQAAVLDDLAWRFMESGWSLKALHREILLSATYRQASVDRPEARAVDPENRLLWRMNRRRLEWEPLRDALLAVSGRLNEEQYGRPVDVLNSDNSRRTVYGFIDRQDLPNLFRVFDIASPDQSAASRPQTTVPQQALFLMNSPFLATQAKSLLGLPEIRDAAEPPQRIDALYRRLFIREPAEAERTLGLEFLAQEPPSGSQLSTWEQYAQALLLTNEFAFVD